MLVVIGMIVLLIGIATPMITRAWRLGDRTRTAADLQAIAAALDAYKQDHGDYPQVGALPYAAGPTDFNGARMLCRALIGPGPETSTVPADIADGKGADVTPPDPKKPGPGFRTRRDASGLAQGRVYGPYLKPEQFRLADPSNATDDRAAINAKPGLLAIMDRYNRPILYYPAHGKPNIRLSHGYVWDRTDKPMYLAPDNDAAMTKQVLAQMLGDVNGNGMIDAASSPPEAPAYEGPFILWSAGPDETFGPDQATMNSSTLTGAAKTLKAVQKSDDVTNFPR